MNITLPQWVTAGLAILFIGGTIFAFWQGSSLADEIFRMKQRKLFSADLIMSLINKGAKLTLAQIQQIAETRGLSQHDIQRTLKVILREVLAKRNLSLEVHQELIESLLQAMKDKEPFDGLPNEIRIHLERLREDMQPNSDRLYPLTAQIRELVSVKGREHRIQKYYSIGGFILGVIGLLFAAYAYWIPPIGHV